MPEKLPENFTFECGVCSAHEQSERAVFDNENGVDLYSAEDRMLRVEDRVGGRCLPYEGTRGLLFGGRESQFSVDELCGVISFFGEHRRSFMVPMNGGLLLDGDVPLDLMADSRFAIERQVLDCLADTSAKFGVKNWVTLLRDDVNATIMERFPELGRIASCIKFVGGRKGVFKGKAAYIDALREYNRVVVLNQHASPDFVAEFGQEDISRLVFFTMLGCDSRDLYSCYLDYMMMEDVAGGGCDCDLVPDFPRADFDFIPSQICRDFPGKNGYCNRDSNESWYCTGRRGLRKSDLLGRPRDLWKLISGGAKNFKFDRRRGIPDEYLLGLIAAAKSAEGEPPEYSLD